MSGLSFKGESMEALRRREERDEGIHSSTAGWFLDSTEAGKGPGESQVQKRWASQRPGAPTERPAHPNTLSLRGQGSLKFYQK